MGIAALILGILSLIMMFLILVAQISFGAIPSILAIVGIILGIMGIKNENDGKAKLGLILCVIYVLIFIVIAIRSYSSMQTKLNLMSEGMDYAAEKASQAQSDMMIKMEKEDIELAVSMVMFGSDSVQSLTYENLDQQLKEKFGTGNYKLNGPDSKGNFTLKIETRTYTIYSNGAVKD